MAFILPYLPDYDYIGGKSLVSEVIDHSKLQAHPKAVDRVLASGEVGMGGPESQDWLLADGAYIRDVSSGWTRIRGGRFRVALADAKHTTSWVAYDSIYKILYVVKGDKFRFHSGVAKKSGRALFRSLHKWSDQVTRIPYQLILGAWVPDNGEFNVPLTKVDKVLSNACSLSARLLVPDDVRAAPDPIGLLRSPPYELSVDGESTGLHVLTLDDVQEGDQGRFAIRGVRLRSDMTVSDGLWHIWYGNVWHTVLDYVTPPYDAGGMGHVYFLSLPLIRKNRTVQFPIESITFTNAGIIRKSPPSMLVSLRVAWRDPALILPVEDGSISLRLKTAEKGI